LAAEHDLFLKGLNEHGTKWEKIAKTIKTRSISQVPSHAQKHFQRLLKEKKEDGGPGNALSSSISMLTDASTTDCTSPVMLVLAVCLLLPGLS